MIKWIKNKIYENRVKSISIFKQACIPIKHGGKTLYLDLYKDHGYGDFGEVTRIKPKLYDIGVDNKELIYTARHAYSQHEKIYEIVEKFSNEYKQHLKDNIDDSELLEKLKKDGYVI